MSAPQPVNTVGYGTCRVLTIIRPGVFGLWAAAARPRDRAHGGEWTGSYASAHRRFSGQRCHLCQISDRSWPGRRAGAWSLEPGAWTRVTALFIEHLSVTGTWKCSRDRKGRHCCQEQPTAAPCHDPSLSGAFFPHTPPAPPQHECCDVCTVHSTVLVQAGSPGGSFGDRLHTQPCVPDVSRPSDRLSPFGPPWATAHGPLAPPHPREMPVSNLAAQQAKTGSMLVPARRHGRGTGSGACSGPISRENKGPGAWVSVRAVWKDAACLAGLPGSLGLSVRAVQRPRQRL